MTPFEYVGQWWLPESPEAGCYGTLRFDGTNSPELRLTGSLRPLARGFGGGESFTPDIILGFTENGKAVTLYQCHETHTGFSFPGTPTSTYIATFAIVGHHFPAKDKVRFEKFWIRYDRLVEWTQLTGFTHQLDMDENSLRGITVDWHAPAPYEVNVAGWQAKFTHWVHREGDRLEHYNLEHQVRLEVQPPEPKSIEGFHSEFANHYRNFVTLGLGKPVYTSHLEAVPVPDADNADPSVPTSSIYHYSSRKQKVVGKIDEFKMLFSLRAISADYADCLQHWYSRTELLRPVYNLYFGTLYSEPGYVETEFLILAQALESYHRRVVGGALLGPERFGPVKEALLSTIGREDLDITTEAREAYERKLHYFDEPALRRRAKEVVRSFGETAHLLIPKAASFADRLANTRNYLTHYDESLRELSAAGDDLWLLAQQVRFVLELCFLREMGLSDERIRKMAFEHQHYLFLRSRLKL
ncbi:MAG: HEPN domain-containing protein [Acidimicrobiia bacterium]